MNNDRNFRRTIKKIYKESFTPKLLEDLKSNFKTLDTVISEVESIINLLFLKSLFDQNNLSNLSLHMAFSGSFGTGKTSLSSKIAEIFRDLNYLTKGHVISVTREDLVGEYVGHTAPKTKEVLQKAQGGILFIDEASQLYKVNNEKDYGSEAIEIILQIMENQRNDLALIFSDDKIKLDHFFQANPGISSRIAHHLYFPNYSLIDLEFIFSRILKKEGQFFLNNQNLNSTLNHNFLSSQLKMLPKLSTYANIRSLENFTHKILTYQAERIYYESISEKKNLKVTNLLEIQYKDFIKIVNNNL